MTEQEAKAVYSSEWFNRSTPEEIARWQLFEERCICPFSVFHAALEIVLGRDIFSHEFAEPAHLRREWIESQPVPVEIRR